MSIASSARIPQLLAASTTLGLLATAVWVTHREPAPVAEPVPAVAIEEAAAPVRITEAVAVRQVAPAVEPSSQLLFTFRVGGELYLKVSDAEPRHGARRLIEDDEGSSTIAEVKRADLPAEVRDWATKTFLVDGGCRATIKGFAVVTRMVGSPSYAGLDDEGWTAKTAAAAGTSQLAARLAVSPTCAKALYARDAALAPIVELETLDRPALVDQARAALLATAAARDAEASYRELAEDKTSSWIDRAQVQSFVRRHPGTGQVFVGIHASIQEGCGGPDANVWGLYRVEDGALVQVAAQKLESLYAIEKLIDLDNDGKLELVGHDWLGMATLVTGVYGEVLAELPLVFHGCPC